MKRFFFGFIVALFVMGSIWFFTSKKDSRDELNANSTMIQEQIQQVGKLIVTEAYYSQVFTYRNSQKLFLSLVSADKKAIIIAKAKATVEYDLRKLETEINQETKTVTITKIPDPLLNVYPEFEYYDVTQDYLNQFEAKDYNKIKNSITDQLRKKIEDSALRDEAHERLVSELLNIYILTKSLGWTLKYDEIILEDPAQMENLSR